MLINWIARRWSISEEDLQTGINLSRWRLHKGSQGSFISYSPVSPHEDLGFFLFGGWGAWSIELSVCSQLPTLAERLILGRVEIQEQAAYPRHLLLQRAARLFLNHADTVITHPLSYGAHREVILLWLESQANFEDESLTDVT
jgi:hypothetical protein